MNVELGEGIVLSITKYSDKSLIIRVLDKNDRILSGTLNRAIGSRLALLDHVEFGITITPGKELVKFTSVQKLPGCLSSNLDATALDYYFIIAELSQQIIKDQAHDIGLFELVLDEISLFNHGINSEFYLSFLVRLLSFFGYAPSRDFSGIYFDLREGKEVTSHPGHPDYCDSSFVSNYYLFSEVKRDLYVFRNSSERLQFFRLLVRYFELQSGHKISLNSIEILRQLRD